MISLSHIIYELGTKFVQATIIGKKLFKTTRRSTVSQLMYFMASSSFSRTIASFLIALSMSDTSALPVVAIPCLISYSEAQLKLSLQRNSHNFFDCLLTENSDKLQMIYSHIFNKKLFDGSLPSSVFGRFLKDDYYYLHHFSETILSLCKHAGSINSILGDLLNRLGRDIVDNELAMQLEYAEHLEYVLGWVPPAGCCISQYVAFLSETARVAQLPVALCSILPCFWIYSQLGIMNSRPAPTNPYHNWIATYTADEFLAATQQLVLTISRLAVNASSQVKAQMAHAFSMAVKFELDFFDHVCDLMSH